MTWVLDRVSVSGGVYRGVLRGQGTPPALEMALGGEVLGRLTPEPAEGGWHVTGEIGAAPLSEGTQTVVIRVPGGDALDAVTVVCGLSAPRDLRAEVEVLRAELAVLKQAFRRHVAETGQG